MLRENVPQLYMSIDLYFVNYIWAHKRKDGLHMTRYAFETKTQDTVLKKKVLVRDK